MRWPRAVVLLTLALSIAAIFLLLPHLALAPGERASFAGSRDNPRAEFVLTVTSDTRPLPALQAWVIDRLEPAFREVPGIAHSEVSGAGTASYTIHLDAARLSALGLSPRPVIDALRAALAQGDGAVAIEKLVAARLVPLASGEHISVPEFARILPDRVEPMRGGVWLDGRPAVRMALVSAEPGWRAAFDERLRARLAWLETNRELPPDIHVSIVEAPYPAQWQALRETAIKLVGAVLAMAAAGLMAGLRGQAGPMISVALAGLASGIAVGGFGGALFSPNLLVVFALPLILAPVLVVIGARNEVTALRRAAVLAAGVMLIWLASRMQPALVWLVAIVIVVPSAMWLVAGVLPQTQPAVMRRFGARPAALSLVVLAVMAVAAAWMFDRDDRQRHAPLEATLVPPACEGVCDSRRESARLSVLLRDLAQTVREIHPAAQLLAQQVADERLPGVRLRLLADVDGSATATAIWPRLSSRLPATAQLIRDDRAQRAMSWQLRGADETRVKDAASRLMAALRAQHPGAAVWALMKTADHSLQPDESRLSALGISADEVATVLRLLQDGITLRPDTGDARIPAVRAVLASTSPERILLRPASDDTEAAVTLGDVMPELSGSWPAGRQRMIVMAGIGDRPMPGVETVIGQLRDEGLSITSLPRADRAKADAKSFLQPVIAGLALLIWVVLWPRTWLAPVLPLAIAGFVAALLMMPVGTGVASVVAGGYAGYLAGLLWRLLFDHVKE